MQLLLLYIFFNLKFMIQMSENDLLFYKNYKNLKNITKKL